MVAITSQQIMTAVEDYLDTYREVERFGYVIRMRVRTHKLVERKFSETPSLELKARVRPRQFAPTIPFLTDERMRELIAADQLIIDPQPGPDQIREATLELRTGPTVFKSKYDLPTRKHVEEYAEKLSLDEEYVLKPDHNYFIESLEKIRLLDKWEGLTHTKSTCGRVGVMCQALDEKYAHIKGGGEPKHIMMSVKPLAFPILIKPRRTRMFQIKISKIGSTYLNRDEIEGAYGEDVTLFDEKDDMIPLENVLEKNGLKLTLNTKKTFVSKKGVHEPIDLTKTEHYDPREYFKLVESNKNGELKMKPKRLYLCSSNERLKIGNKIGVLNREDRHVGPGLWTQLAGFIAPTFEGHITFELWTFYDRIMAQGSPIAKFFLEELDGPVENNYSKQGYYSGQSGAKLAKVFKPWD